MSQLGSYLDCTENSIDEIGCDDKHDCVYLNDIGSGVESIGRVSVKSASAGSGQVWFADLLIEDDGTSRGKAAQWSLS